MKTVEVHAPPKNIGDAKLTEKVTLSVLNAFTLLDLLIAERKDGSDERITRDH